MSLIDFNKTEKDLTKQGIDITRELVSLDNLYRNTAWLSYTVFIIFALFISLVAADFEWERLAKAQFWLDTFFTVGGGLFLRWIFGKYGSSIAHRNPAIKKALQDIEDDVKKISNLKLIAKFKDYLRIFNIRGKLAAIHNKVYVMRQIKPKNAHWKKQQDLVRDAELLMDMKENDPLRSEIENRLFDNGFDITSYPVYYKELKEDTLMTGFSDKKQEADNNFYYNENYQMFGKNAPMTVSSLFGGILLAVTIFSPNVISIATLSTFFSRVVMFTYNAMTGFVDSKSSVETTKLNVLNKIHIFFMTFLELNMKGE